MINRIFRRSTLTVFSDYPALLEEVFCLTITFRGLPEITKARLLKIGYSPPLLLDDSIFGCYLNQRLIGGETVCYCSHLFFSYYEDNHGEN